MNPAADASAGIREGFETSTLLTLPAPGPHAIPPRFLFGERIAGRFRVIRLVGQGGTAHVYEADDLQLGLRVALKVLRPERARNERAARRLRTEVLLARKVTHPNVCRIFDLFLHSSAAGEVPVVAMELLSGETLKDRIRRGPLSSAEALPLVRQMAEALDAAHRVGVAHLDFKSGNVMLVPSSGGPRAVVTDFGLARSTAGPEGAPRPMVGTPAYMAPEQVLGEETSPAADLYALGVVLYEMVTGALPFQGDTSPEIARKRLEGPPPQPGLRVPNLPPVWDHVILRCLERDPARRFATAGDVAAALAPRGAPSWKAWAKTAALCLLLAVPAGFVIAFPRNDPKVEDVHGGFGSKGEAKARSDLALVLRVRDELPEAEEQYRKSLSLAQAANDEALAGLALAHLGELVQYRDLEEGRRLLDRAISTCQKTQYKHCLAVAYRNLGGLLLTAAEFGEAEKNLIHARKLAAELGNTRIFALVQLCLAAVYLEQDRPREAETASTASIPVLASDGLLEEKGMALTLQAQSLLAQGKRPEAQHALRQAMPLTNAESHNVFLRMARIYMKAGQWEDARKILAKLPEKMDEMFALEANIARKVLDLESGQPVCSDLAALEGEARARHALLLAHRAAAARALCEERYLSHR
jgi:tetratricopeptide (TPR) repeat protein/tRNA A-37 threonylcarbamoyl transferase component Bud32